MIEFPPPNSRALLPLFLQNAQMGLILSIWGLVLPRIPPPIPVLYSAVRHSFSRYWRTQNTPKPTPKHPISWPELDSGKMNYCLGNLDPNWAKCLKSGQNFSRSGKKKLNHDRSSRKLNSHFLNLGHIVALYDHTVLANDLSWIPSWSLNLDAWMYWGWWSKRYNAALVVCTIYWCWCLLNYEFQQYLQHRTEKWHMTFFGRSSLTMPRHCSSCG